jgi:WbqC-like protein family
MQPYFFPYLGHFCLIACADRWFVFDITQYTPQTWMNRNRILHPYAGWQYITVPLSKSSSSIKTCEAKILDVSAAQELIARKLAHYKKHAPYYRSVMALVHEAFDTTTDHSLVQLNVRGLQAVCRYLGIRFDFQVCSELNLPLPTSLRPGDWVPNICSLVCATSSVNPVGGKELFDPGEFSRRGVNLYFAKTKAFSYDPSPYKYEPDQSVLDVLMWNSPTAVGDAIRQCIELAQADTSRPGTMLDLRQPSLKS